MTIEVIDHEGANHFPLIVEALNTRFFATKERNPQGYLDQFEARMELHCLEIAGEMGGTAEIKQDGTCRFNFSGYQV